MRIGIFLLGLSCIGTFGCNTLLDNGPREVAPEAGAQSVDATQPEATALGPLDATAPAHGDAIDEETGVNPDSGGAGADGPEERNTPPESSAFPDASQVGPPEDAGRSADAGPDVMSSADAPQECGSTGRCACDATSCPNGCCTASGMCSSFANQNNSSCGTGGISCHACANNLACDTTTGSVTIGSCQCPASALCSSGCTSLQTDAKNCGQCGHVCGAPGAGVCLQGSCQQVALTVHFKALGQPTASIASTPAKLMCSGTICSQTANFDLGASVVLSVSGLTAGAISAWSSGCMGTSCTVALTAAQTVTFTSTTNNIVFLTSVGHDGNLGGVAPADTICNNLAHAAALPGRFVAFLGTSASPSAFSRLSGRGWVRPDGLAFADTLASLQNRSLWYPAAITELGTRPPRSSVMTGTVIAVSNYSSTCSDWTTNAVSAMSGHGFSTSAGVLWNQGLSVACNESHAFLCFGTDFDQPVTLNAQNGLQSGRAAFVTKTQFSGSFGGLVTADQQCQTEAASAGLPRSTQFIALLATTSSSAASRFNLSGAPWVRPDGVLIASTTTDFTNGKFIAPIALHADGTSASTPPDWATYAWIGSSTGLTAAGTLAETCDNWSSAATTSTGWNSDPEYGEVVTWNAYPCNFVANSLLCLEN